MAAPDLWSCSTCGSQIDLAGCSIDVGLVRLATRGGDGFQLGGAGIQPELAAVLASCQCGGRLAAGAGPRPAVGGGGGPRAPRGPPPPGGGGAPRPPPPGPARRGGGAA